MSDSRDGAIRDAKRFVRDVVRNDWEFESSTEPDDTRPNSSSSASSTGTLCQNREVIEWRCREFDSSGSELEPQSSDHDMDGDSSDDPEIEMRRKRRRQMEEEMTWNGGLRMWMARRDAWSGARTRRQILAKENKRKQTTTTQTATTPKTLPKEDADGSDSINRGDAVSGSAGSPPLADPPSRSEPQGTPTLATKTDTLSIAEREKTEDAPRRQEQDDEHSTAPDEEAKRKESSETSLTEPDAQTSAADASSSTKIPTIHDSDSNEFDEEAELDEPLIPVAPPFLPTSHPIRASINESLYPSIYSKVVVQGMTPTVPVNLADLTKAMVHGWKSDGQWPPKPAVSSIVLADDASVPKKDSDPAAAGTPSRRKNSITNAMRKVFHIGSHPFHRRGSHDAGQGNSSAAA